MERTLSFPPEASIGSLLLMPKSKGIRAASQISGAKGVVKVTVPSDKLLIFEPNQRVFLHPEMLDNLSVSGIDILQVSFLSMNAGEEDLCDKVLAHLSRFTHIEYIVLDNSDATDAGITSISRFTRCTNLSAQACQVRGIFLQKHQLPHLSSLDLTGCRLTADVFKYLCKYPDLKRLRLSNLNLDSAALREIGKCSTLTQLDINDNHKIDDEAIKALIPLQHLESLKLHGTLVTTHGLSLLQKLPITVLEPPRLTYTAEDLKILRTMFPKAHMEFHDGNKGRTRDLQMMLAPTSRGANIP